MLSGETAIGRYPVETVKTMSTIAERTERDIDYVKRLNNVTLDNSNMDVTNALSHATCTTAHDLRASAIIALTYGGTTAQMISKFRPSCPIIAPTISQKARRQLNLSWGVIPVMSERRNNTDELFDHAVECAQKTNVVKNGDLVVITGGAPIGVSGTTNVMKVHLVGHILTRGVGITKLHATAKVCVADSVEDLERDFEDGAIVVNSTTTPDMVGYLKKASGIITEEKGEYCYAAIIGMALDIPVITGASGAVKILKTGTVVTVDAAQGHVYGGAEKL